MSAVDAIGALPGGGAFLAVWEQVDGDAGAINDLAAQWHDMAGDLEKIQDKIGSAAHGIHEGWQGPAAEAFTAYMQRFKNSSADLGQGLTRAASVVQEAGAAVEAARGKVEAVAGRLLDAVDRMPRGGPLAEVEQDAIGEVVAEATAEVRPVASSLTEALSAATRAVQQAVHDPAYLGMDPTHDTSYLPQRGKPITWNPIPKDGVHGGHEGGGSGSGSGSGSGGSSGGGGGSGDGGGGGGGHSGPPPKTHVSGNVKSWIEQAQKLLESHGVAAGKINADDIALIIQHESGGNPHAENDWDSNAAAGHPSKGLMQTIDSTFNAHALPGHKDIWNPVDNIVAGVRYALGRYGSLDNVPGVKAVHDGGSYVGY